MMFKILFSILAAMFVGVSAFAADGSGEWKIVPNKEVCMVTDMHFARPQIPVTRDGKTYYGCCENCKATIQKDASSRTASDPLTKKPVDKATAVIAANASGSVLYFANRANFDQYVSKNSPGKAQ